MKWGNLFVPSLSQFLFTRKILESKILLMAFFSHSKLAWKPLTFQAPTSKNGQNAHSICRVQPTNYLSEFDQFVVLAFKGDRYFKLLVWYSYQIKKAKQCQLAWRHYIVVNWRRSGVFIVNFECIWNLVLSVYIVDPEQVVSSKVLDKIVYFLLKC